MDVLHRSCSGYKYYQFGYYYAFELDNESRQVCVIVTPLATITIIDCLRELTNFMTLPKKSWRLCYVTFLIVRFTWMILEISAIAGTLLFRSWSKYSKGYKLTNFIIHPLKSEWAV